MSSADHADSVTDAATLMVSETGNPAASVEPADGAEPASGPATAEGAPEPLQPGQMVGEYRIERLLGRGGMGWVYEGIHPVIEKRVAVKVLKPALAEEPEAVQRFVSEAKAVNRIGHPCIVNIFAFGQLPNGAQYFIMDYLPGESLCDRLDADDPLTYAEAKHVLAQIMDALEAAHEMGIIHRDLKPDNIYLAHRKQGFPQVKLLDFGVAKLTEEGISEGRTRTGVPIGTPAYMSPEQCRGRAIDFRSDLYSLGVILYELFTGDVPFTSDSYMEVIFSQVNKPPPPPCELVELPQELEAIILWCLQKSPDSRPQDVAALRTRLLECLDRLVEQGAELPANATNRKDQAISFDPTVTPDQLSEQRLATSLETSVEALEFEAGPGRRRWAVIAPVVAVVAVLGGGGLWYGFRPPPGRKEPASQPNGPDGTDMRAGGAATDALMSAMPAMISPPKPRPMPAPPAVVRTVTVKLRSTPPGAAVFHNGKQIATTPKDLTFPRGSKPTRFRFVLKGRRPVTREVTLAKDLDVEATLRGAPRRLRPQGMKPKPGGFKLNQ